MLSVTPKDLEKVISARNKRNGLKERKKAEKWLKSFEEVILSNSNPAGVQKGGLNSALNKDGSFRRRVSDSEVTQNMICKELKKAGFKYSIEEAQSFQRKSGPTSGVKLYLRVFI
jgi:hypothetical protein